MLESDRRDELISYLEENGVSSGIYYPVPLHLQTVYNGLGYSEGSFSVTEAASKVNLALPLYPELTDEMQDYVISVVRSFYKERGTDQ